MYCAKLMSYRFFVATSPTVTWSLVESGPEYEDGIRLKITHSKV